MWLPAQTGQNELVGIACRQKIKTPQNRMGPPGLSNKTLVDVRVGNSGHAKGRLRQCKYLLRGGVRTVDVTQ